MKKTLLISINKTLCILVFVSTLNQTLFSQVLDTPEQLNTKYWNMRERFRKYFISIGTGAGQSIPIASKRGFGAGGYCSDLYLDSEGTILWSEGTGYMSDYMCTLSTEYALLTQEGKDTKGTLNELYYVLSALDRLDAVAEDAFFPSSPPTYNGFFLRDDVKQSTAGIWNTEYVSTGSVDAKLNYKCIDASHMGNFNGDHRGNSLTNEPSLDQIVTIFQGFSFIKKYVPNVYVKPTASDLGFNIIDKMKEITVHIMDYMSGSDRTLLRLDHNSELLYDALSHPTPSLFGPGTPLAIPLNLTVGHLINTSDCGDNDIRGNWILSNPITGRKVGVNSSATGQQDIRLFSYAFAKVALNLTGDNQYLSRDIHHEAIDHFGDSYFCLSKHDYHIPLTVVKTAWEVVENLPPVPVPLVITLGPPISITGIKNPLIFPLNSLDRNMYLFESLSSQGGTWSHSNVSKFANQYNHINMDLVYSCLNDKTPLKSQTYYTQMLSYLTCNGPHNEGLDYTLLWNKGNAFEHPSALPTDHDSDSYTWGEFNANDWMWMYNMYRLKFNGSSAFPSYSDVGCNCVPNPILVANTNLITNELQNSISINRVFENYLDLGISLKEYINQPLKIYSGKILTNKTDLVVCNSIVLVKSGGILKNINTPSINDSVKITVYSGSLIEVETNGKLDIGTNTKLIIKNGAFLKANGVNAKIIVRNGGKLILESWATLDLLNSGELTVEAGGQLIVEAKAITTINNNSKLIIEDNGYAVFKTVPYAGSTLWDNSKLIFNQGANIQLKGNNAILELNGQLHIGDNAIFSISHPGGASGFIKFNRGAGVWWNNWLPGNAHITCGINSKINLVGQTKTDKMIEINQLELYIPKNLSQFTMTKCLVEFNVPNSRMETSVQTAIGHSTFIGTSTSIPPGGTLNTRGLLVFGQDICIINQCDFLNLGSGLTGALFYGGYKLKVTNSNVTNCRDGIITFGAGVVLQNNNFYNNGISIFNTDIVANSFMKNNIINSNIDTTIGVGCLGVYTLGTNIIYEAKQNTINNMAWGFITDYNELILRCNNIKTNSVAALTRYNAKLNMSTFLGGGYNDASNCNQFAKFDEAGLWDANSGYNSFKINDNSACYDVIGGGPGHPITRICPTITEGTIINFNNFNSITGKYEQPQEYNYWYASSAPIERTHNKIQKSPDVTAGVVYEDILGLNPLSSILSTSCPAPGGGGSGSGVTARVHPLEPTSLCSNITTASFYSKRLQWALQHSMNKMNDLQDSVKLNEATDLLIEILKVNYSTPVLNKVDNYLLELAYQRLFACVAQLVELNRENGGTMNPMPANLVPRFADLHTIINLRITRKSVAETDYKIISDLVLLDRALIYRLAEQRSNAIAQINAILANNPKIEHKPLYDHWLCIFTTEENALNNTITVDDALLSLQTCRETYVKLTGIPGSGSRMNNTSTENLNEVVYANEYAIAVYPNPTTGSMFVAYDLKEFRSIILEIIDIQGKKVKSFTLNSQNSQFNVDNLNIDNGVYMYSILADGKNIMSKKIVVLK